MAPRRALKVAVVGSGPAGFYAADALLKSEDPPVEVDLLDRLPTPWGLVRLGVAPDHENIKAVSRAFEKTAARPGFRFFGNVEVGSTVTHEELLALYDAVVYTVGAQTDRRLGIPGEDLPGSWPATAFVAWYNGHPDFQDLAFDLVVRAGRRDRERERRDRLRPDARADRGGARADRHDRRRRSRRSPARRLREIVMLGRRGPVQAAFTPPELKELGELAGADVIVDPDDLELDAASERELEADRERARRNFELLREYAARPPAGKPRRIVLRFLVSPVAILGDDRVEGVEIVRNELVEEDGRLVARPTGETEVIPAGLVLRSVGYKGVALPGVPFDEQRGTIPNDGGRVAGRRAHVRRRLDQARPERRHRHEQEGRDRDGRAAARGRARREARASRDGRLSRSCSTRRASRYVEYAGWQAIDAAERAAGEPLGRPRVKLRTWESCSLQAGRPR